MGAPVARMGDSVSGFALVNGVQIPVSGVITGGCSSTTKADGLPIALDGATGGGGIQFTVSATAKTKADGLAVVRLGDPVTIILPGPGTGSVTSGSPTVFAN